MKNLLIFSVCLMLAGCVSQSAMPLGNDRMEIDVSASHFYGRAQALQMALKRAAQSTVDMGYDKFIVLDNDSWTENSASGGGGGGFSANRYNASGSAFSGWATHRSPETKMVIQMYHYHEKGSEKAVDARAVLAQP